MKTAVRTRKLTQAMINRAWEKYGPEMKKLGIRKYEITIERERDNRIRVFAADYQFGFID